MSEFKTAKFTITATVVEIRYNSRMKKKKKKATLVKGVMRFFP